MRKKLHFRQVIQSALKELCESGRSNNFLNQGASNLSENIRTGRGEDFGGNRVHREVSIRLENDYLVCLEAARFFSLEYRL